MFGPQSEAERDKQQQGDSHEHLQRRRRRGVIKIVTIGAIVLAIVSSDWGRHTPLTIEHGLLSISLFAQGLCA